MDNPTGQPQWDLRIRPQSSLFNFHLADTWAYRDLLFLLVKRDIVSFYKQTVLGPLWFFVQPLLTTVMYVFIFGNLAGLSTDGLPGPLFYMTGVVSWNYFAECLTKTSTVFRDNSNLFGKVYFPRVIMPLSIVASNLVRFGIQFLLLLCVIVYYVWFKSFEFKPSVYLLMLPFIVFLMACLGLGSGLLISALTTKYRDLSFLVVFGVQLLMYATPVIYPFSAAPEKVRQLVALNPMTPLIEAVRLGLLGRGDFTTQGMMYSVAATAIILFLGVMVFNKVEKTFIDSV